MDNAFNTPVQVLDANMNAGEGKAKLPILKCILLGIMAGAFIAFGGASSNAALGTFQDSCWLYFPSWFDDDCLCGRRAFYRGLSYDCWSGGQAIFCDGND